MKKNIIRLFALFAAIALLITACLADPIGDPGGEQPTGGTGDTGNTGGVTLYTISRANENAIKGEGDITLVSTRVAAGETVTMTIVASDGIKLKELKVFEDTLHELKLTETTAATRTFIMPACNVTYIAVFETTYEALNRIMTSVPITNSSTWDEIADLNTLLKRLQEQQARSVIRAAEDVEKELINNTINYLKDTVKNKINSGITSWFPQGHFMENIYNPYREPNTNIYCVYYLASKTGGNLIEVKPPTGWKQEKPILDVDVSDGIGGNKKYAKVNLAYAIGLAVADAVTYELRIFPSAQFDVSYAAGLKFTFKADHGDEGKDLIKGAKSFFTQVGDINFFIKSNSADADFDDSNDKEVLITVKGEDGSSIYASLKDGDPFNLSLENYAWKEAVSPATMPTLYFKTTSQIYKVTIQPAPPPPTSIGP